MAIHKRGYQRYEGPRAGLGTRLMVLPRYAWEGLMQQRQIIAIFIAALFWPLACLSFVYLSNHKELLIGMPNEFIAMVEIDGGFFVNFMNVQATFAVFLATFAGPSLIAPDLANGALSLYFSRPLSRPLYILSRMLVLTGILSPVTWIPGVVLFAVQSSLAGWNWTVENWMLGVGVFCGLVLWMAFVALVAMTSSAYVRWRVVSGGLVLGFFFVLTGATELTSAVLGATWPAAFNPAYASNQIWHWMLGVNALEGPSALQCFLTMMALSVMLLYVLDRKLRPVEVIS